MVHANDTIHNKRSSGAAVTQVSQVSDTMVAVMVESILVVLALVAPARFD